MRNLIHVPPAKEPGKDRDNFLEILGTVVHKLSQPLTSLHGSIEVALMEEGDESECRIVLQQSLQELRRMAKILGILREVIEIEGAAEDIQEVSWTRSTEISLKEATSIDKSNSLRFIPAGEDDIWVKASPRHLDAVTSGLMRQMIKGGGGKRLIRIGLSVHDKDARLLIYDEGSSNASPSPGTDLAGVSAERLEPEDFEWWIIRRAVEHMGGQLKIGRVPTSGSWYELRLPLVPSEMAGKARSQKR